LLAGDELAELADELTELSDELPELAENEHPAATRAISSPAMNNSIARILCMTSISLVEVA
jgi:hypothetical protein